MNHQLLFLLGLLAFCGTSCTEKIEPKKEPNTRPNVVFINVDDLGWKDLGFMDDGYFETPNIDRFAKEALTFTQSYSGAANCAPSRACLMTGQYTPRHGIYTVSPSARGQAATRKLIPIKNADSLLDAATTMAEMFKRAGYTTGTFGKWHLGSNPLQQGFDRNVGGSLRGNPGKDGYFSPYTITNIENGPEGEHLTDRLTNEAIQFLKQHKSGPFFLYLPFYSVHTPLIAKKNLIKKYRSKTENPLGINPVYGAMVETMDTNVGRLLNALELLGLKENTLVVFTSDNGGIRAVAPQNPLRGGKGSYYEGGIRVPCMVRWPEIIKPGTQSDEPLINLDFFPTFSDILKIDMQEHLLDGQSMLPVFKGDSGKARALFWHFPIYLQAYDPAKDDGRDPLFRTRPGAAILAQEWKLHWYFEDQGIELYHLPNDTGERNNVVNEQPEKAKELLDRLKAWQKTTQAPIPTELNPAYRAEK